MNLMKENMLMNMNMEALYIKDFVRYMPNAVDDIYFHLGKMTAYEEMYKEIFNEYIPESTLKNITHACLAVYNWDAAGRC